MNGNVIKQPHMVKHRDWIEHGMLPEEGKDHKRIAKLRVQDFEQQAEKDKARQNRDPHHGLLSTLKMKSK